jgi:hypothetical protein
MTSTPQYLDYSIPPSPIIPPVPVVSPASSISSLNSLYQLDEQRLQPTYQYTDSKSYFNMSNKGFTQDDLSKAFEDRLDISPRSSPGTRLLHDISDPQSPWKQSIRLRYSDVNMRDSNKLALQEASDLLSQDMSSYVSTLLGRLMEGEFGG